jgi:hypothetical protein
MSGNVDEWNFDWYPGFERDSRVLHGGSYFLGPGASQLGTGFFTDPNHVVNTNGFRPARNAQ